MTIGMITDVLEQGLIYGILALGLPITYRILDFPDLTVDSSFPLGAAVSAVLTLSGVAPWLTLICSLLAGALSSVIALASVRIFSMGSQTAIITGAIMPLLPGLAITNAIRDTVNGDLVSGVARTAEALLKAIAIAAGVGVVIALWR